MGALKSQCQFIVDFSSQWQFINRVSPHRDSVLPFGLLFSCSSQMILYGSRLHLRNDDMLYPLLMLPPRTTPAFWHAIFIIMVNDTLVCQATMVLKCVLLIYYTNNRGRNYRRQGQMLTLVEYLLLLYRALLPAQFGIVSFLIKNMGAFSHH